MPFRLAGEFTHRYRASAYIFAPLSPMLCVIPVPIFKPPWLLEKWPSVYVRVLGIAVAVKVAASTA